MLKISECMTPTVLTVKPLDSIAHTREVMIEKRINQMPVVKSGELLGIVTDRDIRDAFPSALSAAFGSSRKRREKLALDPKDVTVEMVMTSGVVTLEPEMSMAAAAKMMRDRRIGAVPIVSSGKLVGIITRSDVLGAYLAIVEAAENGDT